MFNKMLEDITVHHYLFFTPSLGKKKSMDIHIMQEIQHLVSEIKTQELPTFPPLPAKAINQGWDKINRIDFRNQNTHSQPM